MPDVVVSENVRGPAMDRLAQDFDVVMEAELWRDPARLRELLADARALVVRNQTQVTSGLLDAAPRLQVIARAGVGLDNVDVAAARKRGIVVVFAPDQNSISVAELTLGMMLALARRLAPADRSTRAGQWNRHEFTGVELYGKTLGILGIGRIGVRTALRAQAFGMQIIAHDEYAHPDGVHVSESGARLVTLSELLAESDFVACHLPLTPQTRGSLNYEKFARMKPTAYFVNTSRGEVVDEPGLVQALEEGKIAGAALDVRAQEPPPAAGPLCRMDNVLLTPHVGAFTVEGQRRVVEAVCADVAAVLSGGAAKQSATFPRPQR